MLQTGISIADGNYLNASLTTDLVPTWQKLQNENSKLQVRDFMESSKKRSYEVEGATSFQRQLTNAEPEP